MVGRCIPPLLMLLCVHGTSCAPERKWALWGRVYTANRSNLGLEQAKKLIAFCVDSRAEVPRKDNFGLLLSVVEGTADD
jgi:hypothetical protein